MPQLNLNFANLPEPLMRIWEQPDSQLQCIVIETLARILNRVSQSDKPGEHANDWISPKSKQHTLNNRQGNSRLPFHPNQDQCCAPTFRLMLCFSPTGRRSLQVYALK
jgi:hypothetical protein